MVPLVVLLNNIDAIVVPEQTVCEDGVTTATARGFTNTFARLAQLLVLGVIVNVTYKGAVVVLINAPVILPVPLLAIPVTVAVLFLVHA